MEDWWGPCSPVRSQYCQQKYFVYTVDGRQINSEPSVPQHVDKLGARKKPWNYSWQEIRLPGDSAGDHQDGGTVVEKCSLNQHFEWMVANGYLGSIAGCGLVSISAPQQPSVWHASLPKKYVGHQYMCRSV